jgi:hypothetical protein
MTEIRKALLGTLAELSERYPPMRLGQLTCMVATLASDDAHCLPSDIDDAALYQAAHEHYSESARARKRAELSSLRRHLLAMLSTSGTEQSELGKWLCTLADQAHSNIYDVEDEELLAALNQHQAASIPSQR